MVTRRFVTLASIVILALTLGVAATSAQSSDLYIQINHGEINVNSTEQPTVVVQFGNRGQAPAENVGVVCGWTDNIRVTGQTQDGPFGAPDLIPPPLTAGTGLEGFALFAWDGTVTLNPGQNFNVGFQLRFADPNRGGEAGILRCWTTDGQFIAESVAEPPFTSVSNTVPVELRVNGSNNGGSANPYIQINHGNINVNRGEQPFVVVQFGNRGQGTLEDAGVVCGWNNATRVTGQTQNGPFGAPTLFPPPVTAGSNFEGFAIFAWAGTVDLRPGQNFNIAFQLRFLDEGEGGTLQCFLTDGAAVDGAALVNADIIAESNPVPVTLR